MERCQVDLKIRKDVEKVLAEISELSATQLSMFREGAGWSSIIKLDKRLELAVGEKERLFGALRQHRLEHGC